MEATLLARNDDGPPFEVNLRFVSARMMITCTCPGGEPDHPNQPCSHIRGVLAGDIGTLIDGADAGGFMAVQEWIATAGRLHH